MVAANLGSACIPFLGFSSALTPIGGGKFSQSHSTELFRFQSIPNEAMPELKVSGAAAPNGYVKAADCSLRDQRSVSSSLLPPSLPEKDSRFLLLEAWSSLLQQHARELWSSPSPASRACDGVGGGASISQAIGSDQRKRFSPSAQISSLAR